MNKNKIWFVSLVLILSMGILAACAKAPAATSAPTDMATMDTSGSNNAYSQSTEPVVASGEKVAVEIKDFAFGPDNLTVKVGTTVTWTNQDTIGHTATSDDGVFDSGIIKLGSSYSYTFTKEGIYAYHCTPHPYMVGTITVTP